MHAWIDSGMMYDIIHTRRTDTQTQTHSHASAQTHTAELVLG
jgi:hypothetical protein